MCNKCEGDRQEVSDAECKYFKAIFANGTSRCVDFMISEATYQGATPGMLIIGFGGWGGGRYFVDTLMEDYEGWKAGRQLNTYGGSTDGSAVVINMDELMDYLLKNRVRIEMDLRKKQSEDDRPEVAGLQREMSGDYQVLCKKNLELHSGEVVEVSVYQKGDEDYYVMYISPKEETVRTDDITNHIGDGLFVSFKLKEDYCHVGLVDPGG